MAKIPRLSAALLITLVVGGSLAAQEPPGSERVDGDLSKAIDMDSRDIEAAIENLEHTLYGVEQQLVAVTFRQLYGEKIRMERVNFANVDHDLTPGYVFTPIGLDESKKRPGLVVLHGGYHWSLHESDFDFIVRAVEEGYVVIFPEYRGSRGYGKKHWDAQDYGGKDVDDALAAADYLAWSRPFVDNARIGIVGRSRGGMLTLLAIERAPKRFKAAVHVVGLVDFLAYMAYKPEHRRQGVAAEPRFSGLPSENLPAYVESSPIYFVEKIETPLLVLGTTFDRTVSIQVHTQRLIEALKAHDKEFEYKIYDRAPGGHGYNAGDTEQSRDSLNRIMEFLRKYLKP